MAFNRIPLPLTGHTCIISLPPQYRHRIKQHIGGGNLFPISCKRNLLHKPPPPSNYVSKSNPKVYCFCRESPILQDSSTNGATGEQLHEQAREAGYEILRKCGTSSTYSQKLIDSARHLDEISFWNSWSSGNEGEEEDGGGEAEVVEISSPSRSSRWSLKKKMVVFLKACGQILGGCPEMFGTRIHKVKFKFLSGIGVSRNDLPQVIRKYTQLFVCNINKSLIPREAEGEISLKYSAEQTASSKPVVIHVLSGVAAAFLLLSQANQVVAAEHSNLCQIANGADKMDSLPIQNGRMMRMRGMTAKNFDPVRYSGRWFEVASLKRGFAGQGQEDCNCTQGVYTFDMETPAIQVDTFCVHGGPDGYITGIRGRVQCLSEEDTEKDETDLERQEMIKEKCYLRFPTLPFIPKEPYDVIDTDYDNFSLVSGSKDRGFIQIYSRRPDPGREFIDKYKSYLEKFGYDPSKIKDTPQDCEVMSNAQLAAMMSMSGMQQALTNQFPDLQLNAPIEFNPFTSVFDTLKKLIELYFKQ